MTKEKEVYGLIVLDAREASIGLLKGKKIVQLKHLDSTVPSKSVKGGMCVSEDTLLQLEDGDIIPIKEISKGKKILSYSFGDFKQVFNDSFEVFKRKVGKCYELILKEPSNSLVLTPEHKIFIVGKNGIEEKNVDEINVGDMLLVMSNLELKKSDDKNVNGVLSQLLGYMLGDGTVDGNRIIFYDKDLQLLKVYKRFAEKTLKKKTVILERRNSYELRLYNKSFVDFILSNFSKISKPRRAKDIDAKILVMPNKKLRYFIRGLFDAEGYVNKTGIGLRMTNEKIVRKIQLILTRFKIVASVRGPDKFERYELRITNCMYIKNFWKKIGFSSLKKTRKLHSIIKNYRSGKSTRVPISGILVRKLIEKEGLKKEDFKKYSMFLVGRRSLGHPKFKNLIQEIKRKIDNKQTLNLLEKIYNSGLIAGTVSKKKEIKTNKEFYDLYVPGSNCFVANGIVVHNSQMRYDRIREDAINDFLTKIGDTASQLLLPQDGLKGVIIGGPGPVKDTFFKEKYLNYQIQKIVLGVKDIGYTGEYGLEELVNKAQDILEQAAVSKERELLQKFFTELQKEGNVAYGYTETIKALNLNAVDTLLLSEEFDWIRVTFKCQNNHEKVMDIPRRDLKNQKCEICGNQLVEERSEDLIDILVEKSGTHGVKVELISTDTREGVQFREIGGVGAFLRFKLDQ
jgi:stalled ribosome rescue protein Dom34